MGLGAVAPPFTGERTEPPVSFSPPPVEPRRPRHRVLGPGGLTLVCSSALFVSSLDVTVVNVALPALREQLGAGPAQLQWIVDAYTLTLAVLLLLGGALGAAACGGSDEPSSSDCVRCDPHDPSCPPSGYLRGDGGDGDRGESGCDEDDSGGSG